MCGFARGRVVSRRNRIVTALLFPGQGAQRTGMLRDCSDLRDAGVLVDRACELVGRDLHALDLDPAAYASTTNAQCALFVAGVICARELAAGGIAADAMAGHSVGALAAAVACGALTFDDGMQLVDLRGRIMAQAFPSGFTMGAIGGLDRRTVDGIVAAVHGATSPVYAANVNAPDQIAIAGSVAAVDAVLAQAHAIGARATHRLDVVVPAHTPLLAEAAETMRAALADVAFAAPHAAYATNATARIVRDREAIRNDLAASIARPVQWANMTRGLYERGVRTFIETRPGTTLVTLAHYAFPDVRCFAMQETTSASIAAAHREATRYP